MTVVSRSWALGFGEVAVEVVETAINDAAAVDGMNIVINAGENRRSVEINNAWQKCLRHGAEIGVFDDGSALDLFIECPIDEGSRAKVVSGVAGVGTYADDVVGLSLEAVLRTRAPGSLMITSLVGYCQIAARDNYLKLV